MPLFCSYCYRKAVEEDNLCLTNCNKCLHRRYCSNECQIADWNLGHKHWCGKAGEIDYDYEIRESEGKGLGMFALRPFEKGEKILVERPISEYNTHSPSVVASVMELEPINSTTWTQKFCTNAIEVLGMRGRQVFVTMSRANHHCIGNTSHTFVPEHGVMILNADRPIAVDEEITFSYIDYLVSPEDYSRLKFQWGFDCQCSACSDPDTFAKLNKLKTLDDLLMKCAYELQVDHVLTVGNKMMRLYDELQLTLYYKRTLYDMFQIAIARKRTLPQAIELMRRGYEYVLVQYGDIEIEEVEKFRRLLRDPSKHKNYLMAER